MRKAETMDDYIKGINERVCTLQAAQSILQDLIRYQSYYFDDDENGKKVMPEKGSYNATMINVYGDIISLVTDYIDKI